MNRRLCSYLTCLQTVVGEEVARKQCQTLRWDQNMEDTAKNTCTVLKLERMRNRRYKRSYLWRGMGGYRREAHRSR